MVPSENTEQRKLAAIMFTDMVGYSALSQRNEALALELLAENQRLLRTQFPLFNGREVKSTGDGFLVEFPSAVQATQCAVEIQRALAARNATQPAERHIQVRIGIHVGDVVHREADMYGDGVNIAARIEPLAIGGGICLSDAVYAQVRNKLEVALTKLNTPELKHIEVPMDVYRVVLPWQRAATPIAAPIPRPHRNHSSRALVPALAVLIIIAVAAWWFVHQAGQARKQAAAPPPGTLALPAPPTAANVVTNQKSIAVLPFENMSEDKDDNAFFADGIHEDMLTNLALVPELQGRLAHLGRCSTAARPRPSARSAQELGVAYVLEGSVRRAGNKVRVTGQLINARTDEHVWAKSYDRDLTDIFAIQTELATEIAGALQAALSPQEKSLIERRPTGNLAAYDLYLKARAWMKGTRADLPHASGGSSQRGGETRSEFRRSLGLSGTGARHGGVRRRRQFAGTGGQGENRHRNRRAPRPGRSGGHRNAGKLLLLRLSGLCPGGPIIPAPAAGPAQFLRCLLAARVFDAAPGALDRRARQSSPRAGTGSAQPAIAQALADTLQLGLHRYDEALVQSRRAANWPTAIRCWRPFRSRHFSSQGSTRDVGAWLDNVKPSPGQETNVFFLRIVYARINGDWAQVLKLNEQYPYAHPFQTRRMQDAQKVWDFVGAGDLPAARARAEILVPQFKKLLDQQPANSSLWGDLRTPMHYSATGSRPSNARTNPSACFRKPRTR